MNESTNQRINESTNQRINESTNERKPGELMSEWKDFRDLDVWQKCRELRVEIWAMTHSFPADEKYRLVDQMVRASRSATACISEGYGRYHYQENIQFCRQARGSLYELIDHTLVSKEIDLIDEGKYSSLLKLIEKCIWMLNGYIKYLKQKKTGER
jgi:four helix bundle protein